MSRVLQHFKGQAQDMRRLIKGSVSCHLHRQMSLIIRETYPFRVTLQQLVQHLHTACHSPSMTDAEPKQTSLETVDCKCTHPRNLILTSPWALLNIDDNTNDSSHRMLVFQLASCMTLSCDALSIQQPDAGHAFLMCALHLACWTAHNRQHKAKQPAALKLQAMKQRGSHSLVGDKGALSGALSDGLLPDKLILA